MDTYTKRKAVLLLLVLAGFVCYALPFGSVSLFLTVEFNSWEYIYRMIQYSMYRDLTFWVILIPVILLVIETVFLARVDLRLLESAHKYNDTDAKYIAVLPLIGAVLLITWYIGFLSSEESSMFGNVEFGFFLTIAVFIVNSAAVYLVLRRPKR